MRFIVTDSILLQLKENIQLAQSLVAKNQLNQSDLDNIINILPTQYHKKYLGWISKQYSITQDVSISHLKDLVILFDKYFKNEDIYKLKPSDIENKLKTVDNPSIESKSDKKKGAELIKTDGNINIYAIHSRDACLVYGKGTKWCIASDSTATHWDYYYKQGVKFYFIIDTSLDKNNVMSKIAIAVYPSSISNKIDINDPRLNDLPDKDKGIEVYNAIDKLIPLPKKYYKYLDIFKPINEDEYKKRLIKSLKAVASSKYPNTYDVDGDVNLIDRNLTQLPIAFGVVTGNFYCTDNQLTSLEGAPIEVGGGFNCSFNQLTTLEGAPKSVGGNFVCSDNELTTLEGAPQYVGENFSCTYNQLTSLEGAPQYVSGYFYCSKNQLTTLEGAPQYVGRDFSCSRNKLINLKGAPQFVGENFYCSYNKLTQKDIDWLKNNSVVKGNIIWQ